MTVAEIQEYIDRAIDTAFAQKIAIDIAEILKKALIDTKHMLDELDNRPKAKWVATERHLYMCTNCESEFIETSEHNYCPYCGAKMEPYKESKKC